MLLVLRPGLHYVQVENACIFFDILADRYFLLAGEAAACFDRFVAGTATLRDRYRLLAQNLLSDAGPRTSRSRIAATATSSLVDTPRAEASFAAAMASLWIQSGARRELRRSSLKDIIAHIEREETADSPACDEVCAKVAAAFLRARRYGSAIDQCLVRGLAMKQTLSRRGCPASLVFGVTMPFAAHCWVQSGDIVLSDPLDIVLHYRPIFAV